MQRIFKTIRDFFDSLISEKALLSELVGSNFFRTTRRFGINIPMEIKVVSHGVFDGISMYKCDIYIFSNKIEHTYTEKELKDLIFLVTD